MQGGIFKARQRYNKAKAPINNMALSGRGTGPDGVACPERGILVRARFPGGQQVREASGNIPNRSGLEAASSSPARIAARM